MIKAASLIYALFISALVAIFSFGLLLTFSLNKNLETDFDRRVELINFHRSSVEFMLGNYSEERTDVEVIAIPGSKDIRSNFVFKNWGVFKIATVTSISNLDTLQKSLLLSGRWDRSKPALYLRNNDEALKISGNTAIEGAVFVSKEGIEKTVIQGGNLHSKPYHKGTKHLSKKNLPRTRFTELEYPEEYDLRAIGDLKNKTKFNAFHKPTLVLEARGSLKDLALKGNIIIRSYDTLTIAKSTLLTDVIIDAPKVIFEKGFQGNAQVFASKEIIVDSTAQLDYPSVLVISSNPNLKKRILCHTKSIVSGAIFLLGEGLASESNNSLVIEEDAVVQGDVFCVGRLSIYGTIEGSVYASTLLYMDETTSYSNLIFNAKILGSKVPDNFFQASLFQNSDPLEPIIIQQL